jgi:ribonuclease P protein component
MLPKIERVDRKLITQIFQEGRFLNSPSLTFKFLIQEKSKNPRISFVVPKSTAKKAVERNSLRRKGYQALKPLFKEAPSYLVGVFIFKKKEPDMTVLEKEIKSILSKL